MKIEITTTKKKLTKGIISQMLFYVGNDIDNLDFLGKLVNCRKNWPVVFLVLHKVSKNYYVLANGLFDMGEYEGKRVFGDWQKSITIAFETEEEIQHYIKVYREKTRSTKQLFI